jgi:hypothetical protein
VPIPSSHSPRYLLQLSDRALAREQPLESSPSSFHMPYTHERLQPAREPDGTPHPVLIWPGLVCPFTRAAVREEPARFGLIPPTRESSVPLTGCSR